MRQCGVVEETPFLVSVLNLGSLFFVLYLFQEKMGLFCFFVFILSFWLLP